MKRTLLFELRPRLLASVRPLAMGGLAFCLCSLSMPHSAGTAAASQPAKPSITSFEASLATVQAGQSVSLTGVFTHGNGIISPGSLAIVSGKALKIVPKATTTYTLKVTNSAGVAVTKTLSLKVIPAAPSIKSFTANPATIAAGESAALTAVFTNGIGLISPGNQAAVSGKAVSVAPAATTTYTLTVTNSAGQKATRTTTVQVFPFTATAPDMGVNIGWVNDWDPTQMFADAMKQARKFGGTTSPYDEKAGVDAQGWPTQDAGVLVIANNQGSWSAGTYALAFTGQAAVKAFGDSNVTAGPVSYDATTNTSTATVTVGPKYQNVYLVFSQTQRTPDSAIGTGVTNVSLMRPTKSGAPHAAGTLFTDRFLDRLKYFTAVRMMDYLQVNDSTETLWADRSIPAYASQQEIPPHASLNMSQQYETGASYEYAIQLANQTGKDLWLNVPHLAFGGTYAFSSTAWVDNLALLLKYGSDANGNPYTGLDGSDGANPQPDSGPVNPPLNPGLHVYLEYSNEFWSGVGNQSEWIRNQAAAAIAAKDPDLDWDADPNMYDVVWRINAKGLMLMANAFANVYGTEGFGTVYRPVFGGQVANSGTFAGLSFLDSQHGGSNQYVWAIAGAPYADFHGDVYRNSMTATQIIGGMHTYQSAYIAPWTGNLALVAKAENLQGGMLAYEGGQGVEYSTTGSVAAQTNTGMRGVITTLLNSWFARGGGTFFFYKLCSADTWGLATNVGYDIDADQGYSANPTDSKETEPKWGAIKQMVTTGH